ncbi:hypothetical protein JW905_15760 [bacterium]|nr:hypothetical protein [candidate division CSSED10-310 bacterium]
MRFALFLGCTVPARGRNYEMAARLVGARLGIGFVDINDFSCCGFPIKGIERDLALTMCARNLALAEEQGVDVCVLCSACTGMLAEANHLLRGDEELRGRINRRLEKIGRVYHGTVEVKHFSRILHEDIGLERIKGAVCADLSPLRIAPHYGCHYLKPAVIHGGFDQVEAPVTLDELIEAAGASPVFLSGTQHCCGGALLVMDKVLTYAMARDKLASVKAAGAHAICLICPFCAVIYDDNQRSIEAHFETEYNLPALYYPQLLGLAMGMDPNALGFNMNRVKTRSLLAMLAAGGPGEYRP